MDPQAAIDLLSQFKQENYNKAAGRAQQEVERLERKIVEHGGQVPPEASPNLFWQAMDWLDTPRQYVAGTVAGLTGAEGFDKGPLLDAAQKGADTDLTTGELLRKHGILTKAPVTRALVGFVGDVATDPLTYTGILAPMAAGKHALRVAGKAATGNKLARASGKVAATGRELYDDLIRKTFKEETQKLRKNLAEGNASWEDLGERLKEIKYFTAPGKADDAYRRGRAAIDKRKKLELKDIRGRTGKERMLAQGDEMAEVVSEAEADIKWLEDSVRADLDLADDVPMEDLFAKTGVRGIGLLGGQASGYAWLPPFIREAYFEIPGITKNSERLFEALEGPLYHARVDMGNAIDAAAKQLTGVDNASLNFFGNLVEAAHQFPALVSRRIAAGGSFALSGLDETAAARAAVAAETQAEVDHVFRHFYKAGGTKEDLVDLTWQMEQDIASRMNQYGEHVPRGKAFSDVVEKAIEEAGEEGIQNMDTVRAEARRAQRAADRSVVRDQKAWSEALELTRARYNDINPGLGDAAVDVMEHVKARFREFQAIEQPRGVLRGAVAGYFTHMLKGLDNIDDMETIGSEIAGTVMKGSPDFSLPRMFLTLRERATALGTPITTSLDEVYFHRLAQHKIALEEANFFERSAIELGVPEKLRNAIKKAVASKNVKVSNAAFRFMRELHIERSAEMTEFLQEIIKNPALALKAEDFPTGITPFKFNGQFITPKQWETWKRSYAEGDDGMFELAEKLGLRFTQQEGANIAQMDKFVQEYKQGLLGRAGEDIFTRSGARPINEKFQRHIVDNQEALLARDAADIDEDTLNYLKGVLPSTLANAFEETMDTRGTYARIAAHLEKVGEGPYANVMKAVAKASLGFVSLAKVMHTLWWTAFTMRNIFSGQYMAGMAQDLTTLGESWNLRQMAKTLMVQKGKQGFTDAQGKVWSPQRFEAVARRHGQWVDDIASTVDGAAHIGDHIHAGIGKLMPEIPGARSYWERVSHAAKTQGVGIGGLEAVGTKKYNLRTFNQWAENYGRVHVYRNLLEKGVDPRTAARETERVMINYARGKTKFEQDYLNNLIFFYSFTRAQTSNSLKAMFTRPGVLTSQLHGISGVTELMTDPDAMPLPQGLEDKIKTLRGQEAASRFIGRSDSGTPILLQGFGVPMEDVAKWVSIRAPRDRTLNSLIDAGNDSVRRTLNNVMASANPLIKTPIEIAANKSFFFDRPLSDRSLRKIAKMEPAIMQLAPFPFNKVPQAVYEPFDSVVKGLLRGRDNGDGTYTVDWKRLAWMSLLVPGSSRFLSTQRSVLNPALSGKERLARLVSGVRAVEVDPEKSEVFARREMLRQYMIDEGLPASKRKAEQRREVKKALAGKIREPKGDK